ncbi:hypothetical protein GJA_4583 [Janthinobacterium agaricidamnosum NBRC 102515 = DSM 9628]|uniref:Uncharacterized protein n=1 Tax=Janthinobacterium agaricidamnosum NBRC 102515 = DSM 9628 TaxID=1349767 RepID=W0VC22_9BURK|nr:hypothetical protein GJA_4583 [Janthinobacterium agaricidamnosum NBRC 102515 = DSM 9628]
MHATKKTISYIQGMIVTVAIPKKQFFMTIFVLGINMRLEYERKTT